MRARLATVRIQVMSSDRALVFRVRPLVELVLTGAVAFWAVLLLVLYRVLRR